VKSLITMEPRNDCVSAFSIFVNLLNKVGVEEEAMELTRDVGDVVVRYLEEGVIDFGKCWLLLCTLYNLRNSNDKEKCCLLARMVRVCPPSLLLRSGRMHVDTLLGMVQDKRLLLDALIDAMKKSKGDEQAKYTMQKLLLLDIQLHQEAYQAAYQATLGAIQDPITLFTEQRGMLTYPAVKSLEEQHKPLYQLLEIFQTGTLQDYLSFVKANTFIFQTYGLDQDKCLKNIRLLSFVTLASHGQKQIPFTTIASTLQIPLDQVETWVIAAVSHNLITAKMDQLQQIVLVEKYLVRNFTNVEEWKELQSKLNQWKYHVKYVLDGFKQCHNQLTL